MNIGSDRGNHKSIRKSFIFKLVGCTEFMPMARKMNSTFERIGERHGKNTIHGITLDAIRSSGNQVGLAKVFIAFSGNFPG